MNELFGLINLKNVSFSISDNMPYHFAQLNRFPPEQTI